MKHVYIALSELYNTNLIVNWNMFKELVVWRQQILVSRCHACMGLHFKEWQQQPAYTALKKFEAFF